MRTKLIVTPKHRNPNSIFAKLLLVSLSITTFLLLHNFTLVPSSVGFSLIQLIHKLKRERERERERVKWKLTNKLTNYNFMVTTIFCTTFYQYSTSLPFYFYLTNSMTSSLKAFLQVFIDWCTKKICCV